MRDVVQLTFDERELLMFSAMASLGAAIVGTVIGQRVDSRVMSQLVTQLANSDLTHWNALQDRVEAIVREAFPNVKVYDLSGTRASSGTRRAQGPNQS